MITIFIHIPRTAGTTLQAIAREQYEPDEICRIYGKYIADPHRVLAVVTADHEIPTKWVTGHIAYGVHAALDGDYQYVTFLRDPIERTLSVYHYIRHSPGHHLHSYAKSMGLAEFMESGVTNELDNGQVRQIAGTLGELPQIPLAGIWKECQPCRKYELDMALKHLRDFAVVGITERFQESLLQFRDVLGWDIGDEMLHINALRGRPHAQDVGPDTLAAIKRYNRLDQELYEYGLELFEERGG